MLISLLFHAVLLSMLSSKKEGVTTNFNCNCNFMLFTKLPGSTATDRNKLTASKLTANKLTASNADWLKRAILNIFLLSPEPSYPNPHFVTKSLQRNE